MFWTDWRRQQWLGVCLLILQANAGFIDIIDILPYNLTLAGNFIQPMNRYIVQGGSNIGELNVAQINGPTLISMGAQLFELAVTLIGYVPLSVATFQPQACRALDLDAGDGQFANMSALYVNKADLQVSYPAMRRLLVDGDPALNELGALESVPTIQSGSCTTSPSAGAIAEGAGVDAAEGAISGALIGSVFPGPGTAVGAVLGAAVGAIIGAVSAANSQTAAVATDQTTILNSWNGQGQGGGGLLAQINESNYASLSLEQQANNYATTEDAEWTIQNNFTQTSINGWLSLYHNMMVTQTNLTATNNKVLAALTSYTTGTFQQLDLDMAALSGSIAQLGSQLGNGYTVFANMQASIETSQARITFELNNLYGMEEQVVSQMTSLTQELIEMETSSEERRALVLSYWQTRDLADQFGYIPFLVLDTEGIRPTQFFPALVVLTFANVAFGVNHPSAQSTSPPYVPDGEGDNFEHITIMYTKPDPTPGSTATLIVANELYFYAQQAFVLNFVNPQFTYEDLQVYLGAQTSCYNVASCNVWTVYYTHTCTTSSFVDSRSKSIPYTLNNPLSYVDSGTGHTVTLNNPPQYIISKLIGCSPNQNIDLQVFPPLGTVSGNPSYDMQPLYSNYAFGNYLQNLCNNSVITGPVFVYSWLWSKGALLQRNTQSCSTGYRQLEAEVATGGTLTIPYALYTMLQSALQQDAAGNAAREAFQYGTIADNMAFTHVPFVFRPDAAYTLECYMAAYVSTIPEMIPMYALTPLGWNYDQTSVSDVSGDLLINIQGREGLSIPLGTSYIYVGWIECLLDTTCGQRYVLDVPQFAVSGGSYAPARENKIDYILSQAILNNAGERFTNANPLIIGSTDYSLSNWLDDALIDFNANSAGDTALPFKHQVVPASLCDPMTGICTCPCANLTAFCSCTPTGNNTCTCNPLFSHLMTELPTPGVQEDVFGFTLSNYGLISNSIGALEQTTVLSLVPIVWQQRLTYEYPSGPNAPPPFAPDCPFPQHVAVSQSIGTLPQLSVWNSQTVSIDVDIIIGNYSGALAACMDEYLNQTIGGDETRTFSIPACAIQQIDIWKNGQRTLPDALCYNWIGSFTADNLPAQLTSPDVQPPIYVNNIVQMVSNATDVALFNIGLALSVSVANLVSTVNSPEFQAAIRLPPGSAGLIAAMTNISSQALAYKTILIQAAMNVTATYSSTLAALGAANVASNALNNITDAFNDQYAAFEQSVSSLLPILTSTNGSLILAQLINITNAQAIFDAQFSRLLQAITVLPTNFITNYPSSSFLEQLSSMATFLENQSEQWLSAILGFVETIAGDVGCDVLSVLGLPCNLWSLLEYIFVVIVCAIVTVIPLALIYKYCSGSVIAM